MAEKPILFSGPMVRAILDGRKTQTRRVVNLRGYDIDERELADGRVVSWPFYMGWSHGDSDDGWMACPFGTPGDLLWVREAWRIADHDSTEIAIGYPASDLPNEPSEARWVRPDWWPSDHTNERTRPSIHMPRWASRLTLRVTEVRVERLQEITEEDAKAEGVEPGPVVSEHGEFILDERDADDPHAEAFAWLWDAINGDRASWESDPWVWVVGFERIAPPRLDGASVMR